MSAEHNHAPRCCCPLFPDTDRPEPGHWVPKPDQASCPGCPEHGDLATPYTEQETTKVEERPDDDPAPVATCNGRDCGGRPHE